MAFSPSSAAAKSAGADHPRFYLEWSWTKFHVGEHRRAHDLALQSMADQKPNPLFGMAYYNAGRALEELAAAEPDRRDRFRQRAADYYTFSLNFRDHPTVRERRKKLLSLEDVRETHEIETSADIAESSFRQACEVDLETATAKSRRDVCEKFARSFQKSRTSGDQPGPEIEVECNVRWSRPAISDEHIRFHLFSVKAWEGECTSGGQGSSEPLYLGVETTSGFAYAHVMTLSRAVCDHYRQGSRPELGEPEVTTVNGEARLSMPMAYLYLQGEAAGVRNYFTRRYRLECSATPDADLTCQRLPLLFARYHTDDEVAGRFYEGTPRHPIIEGATLRVEWKATDGGTFTPANVEGDAPSCLSGPGRSGASARG